jgi:hypothetical protein
MMGRFTFMWSAMSLNYLLTTIKAEKKAAAPALIGKDG